MLLNTDVRVGASLNDLLDRFDAIRQWPRRGSNPHEGYPSRDFKILKWKRKKTVLNDSEVGCSNRLHSGLHYGENCLVAACPSDLRETSGFGLSHRTPNALVEFRYLRQA